MLGSKALMETTSAVAVLGGASSWISPSPGTTEIQHHHQQQQQQQQSFFQLHLATNGSHNKHLIVARDGNYSPMPEASMSSASCSPGSSPHDPNIQHGIKLEEAGMVISRNDSSSQEFALFHHRFSSTSTMNDASAAGGTAIGITSDPSPIVHSSVSNNAVPFMVSTQGSSSSSSITSLPVFHSHHAMIPSLSPHPTISGVDIANPNANAVSAATVRKTLSATALKPVPVRRRHSVKARSESLGGDDLGGMSPGGGCNGIDRRQKRLERNRESARMSRRRRKQYLEILEDRVNELGEEVDQLRRQHVAVCNMTIRSQREDWLRNHNISISSNQLVQALDTRLARTSQELRVVSTFRSQQLKSFVIPPDLKMILWLTMQNDSFFRGGRAASERLSAARIGERMLTSGTDKASPAQCMWPLLCNEIGLSYEQEEKVRTYQRTVLLTQALWIERHSAFAVDKTIHSLHEATQALTVRLGQREQVSARMLTEDQRAKLLKWSCQNSARLAKVVHRSVPPVQKNEPVDLSPSHHVSANLYVLNHRLQSLLHLVPQEASLVSGVALKKLLRRPSFESLGFVTAEKKDYGDGPLSRENSFASSGSLKRSASSEMSIEGEERPQVPSVSPVEAQIAAAPVVEDALGFLKPYVQLAPGPEQSQSQVGQPLMTEPTNTIFMPVPPSMAQPEAMMASMATASAVNVAMQITMADMQVEPTVIHHERQSSFLPPYLNVVPEEMWPADAADDILMSLVGGDWAIGEGMGIDMDT